jgi:hypothetical protein
LQPEVNPAKDHNHNNNQWPFQKPHAKPQQPVKPPAPRKQRAPPGSEDGVGWSARPAFGSFDDAEHIEDGEEDEGMSKTPSTVKLSFDASQGTVEEGLDSQGNADNALDNDTGMESLRNLFGNSQSSSQGMGMAGMGQLGSGSQLSEDSITSTQPTQVVPSVSPSAPMGSMSQGFRVPISRTMSRKNSDGGGGSGGGGGGGGGPGAPLRRKNNSSFGVGLVHTKSRGEFTRLCAIPFPRAKKSVFL